MTRNGLLILTVCFALLTTACSSPPIQKQKFRNRAHFHEYIDTLDLPDSWKAALKKETQQVSGKFINNMATYLELEGDIVPALLAKYGMDAEISLSGVDPTPAIKKAVKDLIKKGNKKNFASPNSKWLQHEELMGNGQWSEGESIGRQMGRLAQENRGQKRTLSDIDTGN